MRNLPYAMTVSVFNVKEIVNLMFVSVSSENIYLDIITIKEKWSSPSEPQFVL